MILFIDASKYGWAGVLAQPYEEIDKSTPSNTDIHATHRKTVVHHPVTYISGLFRVSQLNWAALVKEVYAIYLSESSAFISQMLMFSSEVTTYP